MSLDIQGAGQLVRAAERHQDSSWAIAVGHRTSSAHHCILHLPDHLQRKLLASRILDMLTVLLECNDCFQDVLVPLLALS